MGMRSAPGRPDAVGIALVGVGSDDVWPSVATILARHGAAATWFVSRALLHDPGALAPARPRR